MDYIRTLCDVNIIQMCKDAVCAVKHTLSCESCLQVLEHPSAGVWDSVAAVPDPEGRGRGATSLLYWVKVHWQK